MSGPIAFIVAALALLLTPGPTNTLLVVAGSTERSWALLWLLLAELAGYLVSIHVLLLAVGAFTRLTLFAHATLYLTCALLLAFMALHLWREPQIAGRPGPVTPRRLFLVTLFNPKGLVFAFAIIPNNSGWFAAVPYLAGLSFLIFAAGAAWVGLGILIGRRAIAGFNPVRIRRLSAVAMLFFAGIIAVGAAR